MKAVVLLFTKKDAEDSEDFPFPNLTQVNVTVEGNPNDIYSSGLAKRDMYREAVRFFNNDDCEKYLGTTCVSRRKYYTDKFACVIDFRTVDDNTISASGRKLMGTQAGILLEIEKEATTTDLSCHVFVIADGTINISGTKLNGTVITKNAYDYCRYDSGWKNTILAKYARKRIQESLRLYFHRMPDLRRQQNVPTMEVFTRSRRIRITRRARQHGKHSPGHYTFCKKYQQSHYSRRLCSKQRR